MSKKALVVGINNYPTSPLGGCENDASELATILEKNEDGSPNFEIKLELNVPTRSKLKIMISELFAGECDAALFYFSGHGFSNELGGYIVTPDFCHYDEGVSLNDIIAFANASKIRNKIIILDSCFSGKIAQPSIIHATAHLNDGITILTSSTEFEKSIEVNGHGVFSNLLISAIQGGAADLRGHISPGGVYAYIDRALGPWDQRPVFKTNVKEFTSLRNVSPQVPLDILRRIIDYFPNPETNYKLDPSFEFTNDPKCEHIVCQPYATENNVEIFKALQKYQSVGLVIPDEETYMYYAAMNSKSCSLTPLGRHYWHLVNDDKI